MRTAKLASTRRNGAMGHVGDVSSNVGGPDRGLLDVGGNLARHEALILDRSRNLRCNIRHASDCCNEFPNSLGSLRRG